MPCNSVENDPIKQIDWEHQSRMNQLEEAQRNALSTNFHHDLSEVDSVMPQMGNASLGKRTIRPESLMAEPASPQSFRSNHNLLTLSHPQKMLKMEQASPNMNMSESSPVVHYHKNNGFDDQDQDQMSKSGFDDILENIDNRSQEGFTALEDFIGKKEEEQPFNMNDF